MSIYWNDGTSLYHYGILGQKWGIRRYQNPDGTLTEEGKKRYYKNGSLTKAGRAEKRQQLRIAESKMRQANHSKYLAESKNDREEFSKLRKLTDLDYDMYDELPSPNSKDFTESDAKARENIVSKFREYGYSQAFINNYLKACEANYRVGQTYNKYESIAKDSLIKLQKKSLEELLLLNKK